MRLKRLAAMALLAAIIPAWSGAAGFGTAWSAPLYFGADLSFANQMADCGARYRDTDGKVKDVYTIFKNHGANLIRVRLWTDGNETGYSNLADVEKTIRSARALGMQVLLDFHYSDSWADGGKQPIPAAWSGITHPNSNGFVQQARARAQDHSHDRALADTLYQYTYYILTTLDHQGLMPELVQVGNEINPEMLAPHDWLLHPTGPNRPIDWQRDAMIINAGIKAVRDAGRKSAIHPQVMLQIAHPQSVEPWFAAATRAGITGYDMIGISYYGFHNSSADIAETGAVIRRLRKTYPDKAVMVVETDYPWTASPELMRHSDYAFGANLLPGYDASIEGQRKFLTDLARTVVAAGGNGVNVWAPDLVPNKCLARGNGSVNALFDLDGNVLPGIDFMKAAGGAP
jgi:arabinogalactan endo-1,4-beta-galactosidase